MFDADELSKRRELRDWRISRTAYRVHFFGLVMTPR
jgi:hypothetical protein